MKTYTVWGTATGKVKVTVEAANKEEAKLLAYGEFYLGNVTLDTDSVKGYDLSFDKAVIEGK